MSTQYSGVNDYGPYKAIDGLYHYDDEPGMTRLDSLVVTLVEKSPWIELDLQESYCINSVKVWDRAEGSGGEFQNYKLIKKNY